MSSQRLYLYDTTLRDGAQTRGVDFSLKDKNTVAGWLDALGLDYVEGGWPGANPTDTAFFGQPPVFEKARFTAFGMTSRPRVAAEEDAGLKTLLDVSAPAVCLVGKTWDYHVTAALCATPEENLSLIRDTFSLAVRRGKEALFDAEHFFDGYKSNPDYAVSCLKAALDGGAGWLVLCDTNGGTLPHEVAAIVERVALAVPAERLGFHGHNDTGNAVAGSLAAALAGCRMVQGTLGGLGERCGNANLLTLIPTLVKKMGFDVGVAEEKMRELTDLSRAFDKLLDRTPDQHAPYVGASAFAHKGGLHASAVAKNPCLYEHMDPATVGNAREVLMSNQSGQSNLRMKLKALNIEVENDNPRLPALLETVKRREHEGYAYDNAEGSFAVLALRKLGRLKSFFTLREFDVDSRGVLGPDGKCAVTVRGHVRLGVGEEEVRAEAEGNGPVHALDGALRKALLGHFPQLESVFLTDYHVRILDTGTATGATTRVLVESGDARTNTSWTTVGVSRNIIAASLEALLDAYMLRLATGAAG